MYSQRKRRFTLCTSFLLVLLTTTSYATVTPFEPGEADLTPNIVKYIDSQWSTAMKALTEPKAQQLYLVTLLSSAVQCHIQLPHEYLKLSRIAAFLKMATLVPDSMAINQLNSLLRQYITEVNHLDSDIDQTKPLPDKLRPLWSGDRTVSYCSPVERFFEAYFSRLHLKCLDGNLDGRNKVPAWFSRLQQANLLVSVWPMYLEVQHFVGNQSVLLVFQKDSPLVGRQRKEKKKILKLAQPPIPKSNYRWCLLLAGLLIAGGILATTGIALWWRNDDDRDRHPILKLLFPEHQNNSSASSLPDSFDYGGSYDDATEYEATNTWLVVLLPVVGLVVLLMMLAFAFWYYQKRKEKKSSTSMLKSMSNSKSLPAARSGISALTTTVDSRNQRSSGSSSVNRSSSANRVSSKRIIAK